MFVILFNFDRKTFLKVSKGLQKIATVEHNFVGDKQCLRGIHDF